ncbi:unnamed protein product [Lactuca saligna]|uniref:Uncharacterized protein n=1 Tax=Lactuca saligna TaxID=75948 RepID=A0AA35Z866_LACSI|nr:unnamed protein product [Lactuca saligna]
MAKHDEINASSIENQEEAWVIDLIEKAMPPPSSSTRIHRVPESVLREMGDYEKYYVPKVVSIGPYHYGNPKLQSIEKLKPVFTKELLSRSEHNERLSSLYKYLGAANMVKELRGFYEEKSTDHLSDKEFTTMMLMDGCFILYYILFIYGEKPGSCRELRSHQIVLINRDLFLLENQIPFKVLNNVMDLMKLDRRDKFLLFFADNILSRRQIRGWFLFGSSSTQTYQNSGRESHGSYEFVGDHLLHRLHTGLTEPSPMNESHRNSYGHKNTFHNVRELEYVGIHFRPSSVMSLAHVEFARRWWRLSAYVKLPPITVDDSTKPMLLNLIAYEMCAEDAHDAWVTSYICLLNSLIDHPEDVKALRKAGVLDNSLGNDQEVATLFKEICTGLVPNNATYSKAKDLIRRHYESLGNTSLCELRHEYITNPMAFITVLALFLTVVQTFFAIWSIKGK